MADIKKVIGSYSLEELKEAVKEKRKFLTKDSRALVTLKKRRERIAGKLAELEASIEEMQKGNPANVARRRARRRKIGKRSKGAAN
ncbi:MAG: hypothetical protein LBU79_09450 [Planctomycetota bacterium]|jgi:hypothetical protein|nr:hypothetical protein [Planctomycetota bacterium]